MIRHEDQSAARRWIVDQSRSTNQKTAATGYLAWTTVLPSERYIMNWPVQSCSRGINIILDLAWILARRDIAAET